MPPVNTRPTHAHPKALRMATPPPDYDLEHEHSSLLCCNEAFRSEFRLCGLQNAQRKTAADIFCPDVRRSPLSHDGSIKHLDVVLCWKGLSLKQAEEVATWERIFQKALGALLSDPVRELFMTLPDTHDRTFRLTQDFEVLLEDLVRTMIQIYFSLKPDTERKRTWFMIDGDLPSFVYNFLRTRDCFIDTYPQPSVRIELVFSLPASSISAKVVWQTPAIDFGDLPSDLNHWTTIVPVYQSPVCGNIYGFTTFPDHFQYSIAEDETNREFGSPAGTTFNWSTFIAMSEICFPGEVRFQRTSRYTIKIGNANHHMCDQTHTGKTILRPVCGKTIVRRENNEARKCSPKKRTSEDPVDATTSTILSADQSGNRELNAKRPRLYLQDSMHCHRCEYEAAFEPCVDRQKDGPRHQLIDSSDEVHVMDRVLSPWWSSTLLNHCSLPMSPPSDTAYNPMDDEEVIRRNYDEFSKAKHSRINTDEARERAEYENMFLEENSDCASFLSENMSGLSLEG